MKIEFLSLPHELRCYILEFLPWRDILRFTSVCKTIHQAYISSYELQYIVELGGQQLLPFTDIDLGDHVPIPKRLCLLRDKLHAWLQFDTHSSKLFSISGKYFSYPSTINNGHLVLYKDLQMKIFPIIPEPSQQTIDPDWSLEPHSRCSVPNATFITLFLDPPQNLVAIAYYVIADINHISSTDEELSDYERVHIELGALDGDGIPPKAVGQTLFLSELLPRYDNRASYWSRELMGSGRHIIFQFVANQTWWLQVWDWQRSTVSNCVLNSTRNLSLPSNLCLLGGDRLLVVTDSLKLYLIEDMAQAPQLLACFLFPLLGTRAYPLDNTTHSLRPQIQARQRMWTSDPKNRLLLLDNTNLRFVISTRIFFFEGLAAVIPWKYWGPLNTRVFSGYQLVPDAVRGSRVLRAKRAKPPATVGADPGPPRGYELRMLDFSPLAVKRQQGLGRVVKEPSTETMRLGRKRVVLTTCLPYVEVVSDRRFLFGDIEAMTFDEDRIYLSRADSGYRMDLVRAEVIEF